MKCPNCHTKITDDSKFCPNCGIDLYIKCPKCGKISSCTATFCNDCGTKLVSDEVEATRKKEKKSFNKKNVTNIFSIIAMSLFILCMALIMGLLFTPLQYDSFYPAYDYTIIGNLVNNLQTLKASAGEIDYTSISNAFISLTLLLTTLTVAIIMLAISIPKFVNYVKNKEYFDFSKRTTFLFALFLITVIYFVSFTSNQNTNYQSQLGGGVIFMLVYAPIALIFNLFAKEFKEDKHSLFTIIFNSLSRLTISIFILVIVFNLGGARFHAISALKQQDNTTQTYVEDFGNVGLISFFTSKIKILTKASVPYVISAIVFSSVSFLLEISLLLISVLLLKHLFSTDVSKPLRSIFGIVATGYMTLATILCLIFNRAVCLQANRIDSIDTYWAVIDSSPLNNLVITCLIFSVLSLMIYIATLVVEKIRGNRGNENEEVA